MNRMASMQIKANKVIYEIFYNFSINDGERRPHTYLPMALLHFNILLRSSALVLVENRKLHFFYLAILGEIATRRCVVQLKNIKLKRALLCRSN